ncbi:hypothetical protein CsSME_00028236 [Camellia sinensis var. sinensis]
MGSSNNRRGTVEVGADGVATITINAPVHSLYVLQGLKECYEQALQRDDVKAIVVTGAKGKFSSGFDITAFGGMQGGKIAPPKPGFMSAEVLTDTVEGNLATFHPFPLLSKPSVAPIDGLALGGGLEVAMAYHARISTPSAQLGLPELRLAVILGFGGTQRLPRLVGLSKALEMMLRSKPVKGEEAHDLGLVDAIVSPDELINTACQWALDILEAKRPWVKSLYKTDKIEPLGKARKTLKFVRTQARKQAPNLEHPIVCINVVEEGIVSGPRAGLWKEVEAFQGLLHSDTCKSLIHIFFAQRGTSRVPGITDRGLIPRRISKVSIFGGGLMGSGIATALILSNYPVAGVGRVRANLQSRVKKGKMNEEKFLKNLSLLKGVLDYESFRDVDMVIEVMQNNINFVYHFSFFGFCFVFNNTSTIDLNLIGEKTRFHDWIIGAHFFSPAHIMPLLAIVHTEKTSPQIIVDLLDVGKNIKKTPIVVGNCIDFAVNKMFFPYTQAALLLVERGADLYQIDRAVTKFGMPMGPFRLCDLVGFGVAIAAGTQFVENFPERTYKSMLIPIMQEDKRLMKLFDKDIVEMVFFPMVNNACRVLAEGIAVKASDLDIAAVMGMGFPPYRGGIMFWADSLGSKYICSKLEEWSNVYDGGFFKPCAYLAERATKEALLSTLVERAKSWL